jgi:hypothetical protein
MYQYTLKIHGIIIQIYKKAMFLAMSIKYFPLSKVTVALERLFSKAKLNLKAKHTRHDTI